ncbi:MAG: hypothetical protein Fur0021_09660 [Candidatus Promineifilaceae bacterium]
MTSSSRQALEKRVQKALFQHALFRWESAVVIALTLLLAAFSSRLPGDIPAWAWLVGGALSEAALVYVSLKDPKTGEKVVANLLQAEFKPERLRSKELQNQIQKGLDYRQRITAAIQTQADGILKDNLVTTAQVIDEWLENIYSLAERLDRYEQQAGVLQRDRQNAYERIMDLKSRQNQERDNAVRSQIQVTLESMQRQIDTIDSLENTMKRARLQLEHTLSALGTIYSQSMLVDAKDIDSGRARRLQHEIAEEVHQLSDILSAMDEVYQATPDQPA